MKAKYVGIILVMMIAFSLRAFGAYEDYDTGRYRANGPPDYRYNDKSSSPNDSLGIGSTDANENWVERYGGNREPDSVESNRMEREIYQMERSQKAGVLKPKSEEKN